jgi:hypothetical protein
MISEKTVELNTTAELLAWLYRTTGVTHTAIGPTLTEEGVLGFDVSYHGTATAAALIQYKRAYVEKPIWTWKLNRTAQQDQHLRLQYLESLGYPVFYAFPHFALTSELVSLRLRLLVNTFWYPPSYIKPTGGSTGHHDVTFDEGTRRWQVNSPEPVEMPSPITIGDVIGRMEASQHRPASIEEFVGTINRRMLAADAELSQVGDLKSIADNFSGQNLLLRHG